jgi:hypothetical protein
LILFVGVLRLLSTRQDQRGSVNATHRTQEILPGRGDEQLIARLAGRARKDGLALTGEGGCSRS